MPDRPNFDVQENEMLFAEKMTPDQRLIIRKFIVLEKKMDYVMSLGEANSVTTARHDRILSPVAAVFIFICSASGVIDLIAHWISSAHK